MSAHLFAPLTIRTVTLRNRIAVSPMCEYSSVDGFATDWHLVHLGSRAVGGAALVIAEATAVEARGRISPHDLGLWTDEHIPNLARVAKFIKQHGAVPGIQLAHAGRKASTDVPWRGGKFIPVSDGGWRPVAPHAIPFRPEEPAPLELDKADIKDVIEAFGKAAARALEAGFELIEIHSAHGYLLHQFLSPLSNHRNDQYGGPFENRSRFVLEVVRAIRRVWPESLPLFIRISATDWIEGGWDLSQSINLARHLPSAGVDLVDCSSGALVPYAKIPMAPGFQVPFAESIRRETGILTGAVGMITEPAQANHIIENGQADLVLLGREMLRDPYWAIHAAQALNHPLLAPVQYARAF